MYIGIARILKKYFIVSEMTYNVSMGTLNPTIPYHTSDALLMKR